MTRRRTILYFAVLATGLAVAVLMQPTPDLAKTTYHNLFDKFLPQGQRQ